MPLSVRHSGTAHAAGRRSGEQMTRVNSVGRFGGDRIREARATRVVELNLTNHPRRDGCRDRSESPDADKHEQNRHDPTLSRDRVAVAVADGRHCCARPPEGVAEAGDVRTLRILLRVQHRNRAEKTHVMLTPMTYV